MASKSVVDVILGEARARDFQDMLAVASVIDNRARMLGVTPQQVVANRKEFNAYGGPLPKGVERYREMAERALREVQTRGPVHHGTFYATPKARGNLPNGLSKVHQTAGDVYFTDPERRAINTAVGTKRVRCTPAPIVSTYAPAPARVGALAAIDDALTPQRTRNVPTPTSAPRAPSRPVADQAAVLAASSLPAGLRAAPMRGSWVANTPVRDVAVPSARPAAPVATRSAPTLPDISRFGTMAPQAPRSMLDRYRETRTANITGSCVAPQSVGITAAPTPTARASVAPSMSYARTPLDRVQERNLASRLSPQTSLAMAPSPTARPSTVASAPTAYTRTALDQAQERNLASRLSPQSSLAMAPTPTSAPAQTASVPTSTSAPRTTNFAGSVGSPRSLERPTAMPASVREARVAPPVDAARFGTALPQPTLSQAQIARYAEPRRRAPL